MFSTNRKISSRQVLRLLVLDFFGKSAVLLPTFAGGMGSREFIFCLILVLLAMLVYAYLVRKLSDRVGDNFFEYLKERLGRGTAQVLVLLFLLYALFNLVYLIETFGTLGSTFILTEERGEPLMLLALLAGAYVALGGGEVRGRVAETLYPVLFYPLIFLMVFCAFHVRPDYVAGGAVNLEKIEPQHLMEMFSVFGGLGFYLFLAPGIQTQKTGHSDLVKGMAKVAAALLALFVILAGAFGEKGISELPWPVLTLMSSARIPGGFLERWDVIFTGILLTGLLINAGTSLHYLMILGRILFPGCSRRLLAGIFSAGAFVLALWCGDSRMAAELYIFANSYVVVPIWTALILLLLCLEKIKGRKCRCEN